MPYLRVLAGLLFLLSVQAHATPVVTENTISWPDDGWYQVQVVNDDGIFEVCAGTRSCEVKPGEYIVINHTTGERFEGIIVSENPAESQLTITGNTISWPDNGWYQVQAVTDAGITEICNGTRFCEVPNGTYIVINHSTGMRYENVVVEADTTGSSVTVSGNTISWPDDGWYQVQAITDEGIIEVCAGTRFCEVPNGTYIVINHSTGMRYENIVIDADTTGSSVTVEGNTISWPDNGWYQVQAITEEGIVEVCAGTRLCEVPNGDYIVINHTTGERFEPVIVDAGANNPDPDGTPLIREQTWENILRNVVALINTDRAIERHAMILDRFSSLSDQVVLETFAGDTSGTLASLGLTMLPLADPENDQVVDYACNSDGTINFTLSPGVPIYEIVSDNCSIGGDVYDGGFFHNGVGREGFFSGINGMNVSLSDGTRYALSGGLSTFFDRVGIRRSIQWTDAAMAERSGSDNYFVNAFEKISESADGPLLGQIPRQYQHIASVQGSFDVSADWTENQQLQVSVDLSLGGINLESEVDLNALPSQWQAGSIDIVAADGSRLTLRPLANDPALAQVEISGVSTAQQVLWSDGFQVRCFGDPDDFPDCQ